MARPRRVKGFAQVTPDLGEHMGHDVLLASLADGEARVRGTAFSGLQLDGVSAVGAAFENVAFRGCAFEGVDFSSCTFTDVQFLSLDYQLHPNTSHIHPHMCG